MLVLQHRNWVDRKLKLPGNRLTIFALLLSGTVCFEACALFVQSVSFEKPRASARDLAASGHHLLAEMFTFASPSILSPEPVRKNSLACTRGQLVRARRPQQCPE